MITSGSYAITGPTHWQEAFAPTTELMVRFGVMYRLSAGALGRADVAMTLAKKSCGAIVGSPTAVINPGLTVGKDAYYPVGGWYPAVGLSMALAAFIVVDNNASGTLKYGLACRSAVDPKEPGAWMPLETMIDPDTRNSSRNTGEVALTGVSPAIAVSMYVQFALVVQALGATSDCRAIIHSVVGVTHV